MSENAIQWPEYEKVDVTKLDGARIPGNKILIRKYPVETVSAGGIDLSVTEREKQQRAWVEKIGEGVGDVVKGLQVGQTILANLLSFDPIKALSDGVEGKEENVGTITENDVLVVY
jgi:co-chaperonin GroES (HSP10)